MQFGSHPYAFLFHGILFHVISIEFFERAIFYSRTLKKNSDEQRTQFSPFILLDVENEGKGRKERKEKRRRKRGEKRERRRKGGIDMFVMPHQAMSFILPNFCRFHLPTFCFSNFCHINRCVCRLLQVASFMPQQ